MKRIRVKIYQTSTKFDPIDLVQQETVAFDKDEKFLAYLRRKDNAISDASFSFEFLSDAEDITIL